MRELVRAVYFKLVDIRSDDFSEVLAPDDYSPSQRARTASLIPPFAPGGECIAVFWLEVTAKPVQGRHFLYHWDGERIDMIHELRLEAQGEIFRLKI
ncbi:hypothetical protein [Sphingopyxis flava]|uniref:RES domain-containing protein n=1 Tax=Sphingopyxis flava TaxID=1507287 RepID=A0A1T5F286_9SPHN|nr:hypothetical protein [Sphingopyxis flava]SKB90251.1 hypothetical protein SAMN06295937_102752 [Sphingopyxis flava]